MKYMLDTNICIYVIRKKPPQVIERFRRTRVDDVCVSVTTLSELEYGVQKSQRVAENRLALAEFIAPLEVMQFNDAAAEQYGVLRAALERKGIAIGSMDMLIAAHALAAELTVVTNDAKELSRVPNLRIENWA